MASPPDASSQLAGSARQLADYAMAFDILGKLAGATTEREVVERAFELFADLFAPTTMVYLSVRDGVPRDVISRCGPELDLERTKAQMLEVATEHAWTSSGAGFDVRLGDGPTREVVRIEGVRFPEYRERYVNLALSVAPVVGLALSNARNFQLVRDEQAKLQSALRAREAILAVVSHDLRNPVASVLVNADTLEELVRPGGPSADAQVADRVRAIRRAAGRMNRLIADLLDIRRLETGLFTVHKTHCVVADVMHDALSDLRPQAQARCVRLEDACQPRVALWCDRDRIVQVLCNLVGNALKFAPARTGVVRAECEQTDTDVRFTIRDNGPGIRADELQHVFDMYWQGRDTKRFGLGLGLAIARGIVEAHGGTIHVESVPGRGAAFRFTIPRPAGP